MFKNPYKGEFLNHEKNEKYKSGLLRFINLGLIN